MLTTGQAMNVEDTGERIGGKGTAFSPRPRASQRLYRPPPAVARIKENCGHSLSHDSSSSSSSLASALEGTLYSGFLFSPRHDFSENLLSMASNIPLNGRNVVKGSNNQMPTKGVLKRSKSFGAHTADQYLRLLNGLNTETSLEHQTLVRRALENPNSLVMTQLMEVVRIIVNKAMEKSSNAHPMGRICVKIIDKEKGKFFLESIINCLREWFNEREKMFAKSLSSAQGTGNGPGTRKWTAYVSFLTELYLNLKCKHRHVKLMLNQCLDEDGLDSDDMNRQQDDLQTSLVQKQSRALAMLLFECCSALVKDITAVISFSPSVDMECLLNVLRSVGRYMEDDNSQRMAHLMVSIRELFVISAPRLTSMSQKGLMEVIELRASRWLFSQSQQLYYFPYTKSDSLLAE